MQSDFFYFIGNKDTAAIPTIETNFLQLLESFVECKIWPIEIPGIHDGSTSVNDLYPAVTYARQSGGRQYNIGSQFFITQPKFQLHVWALDQQQASEIADALSDGLDGPISKDFPNARLTNRIETTEEPIEGSDNWVFVVTLDFDIWAREFSPNPRFSTDYEGSDLIGAIHTYLTQQQIEHRSLNADCLDSYPIMVYGTTDTEPINSILKRIRVQNTTIRFDFTGPKYDELKGLHEIIRKMFSAFQGKIGGCTVLSCENLNEIDYAIGAVDGNNQGLFRVSSDYLFVHRY